LTNNGDDTKLSIVDRNVLDVQQKINVSGESSSDGNDSNNSNEFFDNLFEFNVMSANSIVKGYDLSFSLPEGDVGNMYAIQAMGGGNQISAMSNILDSALSLETISRYGEKLDGKYIRYNPDIGTYRSERLETDSGKEGILSNTYDRTMDILASDSTGYTNMSVDVDLNEPISVTSNENSDEKLTTEQKTKIHNEKIELEIQRAEIMGRKVASSYSDYYKYRISGGFLQDKRPTPLPLKLTLNIYGISSIIPGDIFRVDYLPENYRNAVYFQVMKVSHNINLDG